MISILLHTHQEIIRLNISMDNVLGMYILETIDELLGEHQHGFKREFAAAEVEKVFQTRAQKIKHHHIILAFGLISVDSWNTGTTRKGSIDVDFLFE